MMMVTLLTFLLLAQLFTPAQEQVTSPSTPPVEVLEAEVLTHELRPRIGPNPRDVKPPGAVGSQQIPGVRETIIREQPTIEDRSTELGKVARRSASEPVRTRSERGYIYEYRVRLKSISPKKIKSITWEYQLTDVRYYHRVPARLPLRDDYQIRQRKTISRAHSFTAQQGCEHVRRGVSTESDRKPRRVQRRVHVDP